MELNQFLFPAPIPSYSCKGHLGELIYIPKYKKDKINSECQQFKNPQEIETATKAFKEQQTMQGGGSQAINRKSEFNGNSGSPRTSITSHHPKPVIKQNSGPQDKKQLPTIMGKNSIEQKIKDLQLQKNPDGNLAVPCLFMPYQAGSSKILLFFHGNAEDIGLAMDLLVFIRDMLQVHVIAMEYPGYGIYQHSDSNAQQISTDAQNLYDYLTIVMGIKESDILLFGRSIGTGPATIVASRRKPGGLILMSAFKSIRDVVREQAGSVLQYAMNDRFRNIDHIADVTCPTFLVHGQQDQLIPYSHSQELFEKCGGQTTLNLPRAMDHNEFDFVEDLISPLHNFMAEVGIDVKPEEEDPHNGQLNIPEELYIPPQSWLKNEIDQMKKVNSTNEEGKLPPPQRMGVWNWFLRKFLM